MRTYSLVDWLHDLSSSLNLEIDIPYVASIGPKQVEVVARLRDFGGPNGMLIVTPAMDLLSKSGEAWKAGYAWATLDERTQDGFDVEVAKEVLADWNWAGDPKDRPAWMTKAISERAMHDWILERVQIAWGEGKVVLELVDTGSAARTIEFTGVTHFEMPRTHPWGPSESINRVRGMVTTPSLGDSVEIEMQSGDIITINATGAVLSSGSP